MISKLEPEISVFVRENSPDIPLNAINQPEPVHADTLRKPVETKTTPIAYRDSSSQPEPAIGEFSKKFTNTKIVPECVVHIDPEFLGPPEHCPVPPTTPVKLEQHNNPPAKRRNPFTPSVVERALGNQSTTNPKETILWITVINYGYIEFTKNFLLSMQKARCVFRLVVFCLDQSSIDALHSFQNCVCLNADVLFDMKGQTGKKAASFLAAWGEKEYKEIVFMKLDALKYTIEHTQNMGVHNIGYVDTDVFVLKDPTSFFIQVMRAHPTHLVFHQCDEDRVLVEQCSHPYCCPGICTGIIVFRNDPGLRECFFYSDSMVSYYSGDQALLQDRLPRLGIKTCAMDKNVFMNGSYLSVFPKIPVMDITMMVHFNFTNACDKKQRMVAHDMWLL